MNITSYSQITMNFSINNGWMVCYKGTFPYIILKTTLTYFQKWFKILIFKSVTKETINLCHYKKPKNQSCGTSISCKLLLSLWDKGIIICLLFYTYLIGNHTVLVVIRQGITDGNKWWNE